MKTLDNIGMISINPGRRTSGATYERLHPKKASSETAPENAKCTTAEEPARQGGKHRNARRAPIMQMVVGMITIAAGLLNFIGQLSPLFML